MEFEDGQLYYSRGGRARAKLMPLTDRLFRHEKVDWFRVRFDSDAEGRVFRLTGVYENGNRDESLRDDD